LIAAIANFNPASAPRPAMLARTSPEPVFCRVLEGLIHVAGVNSRRGRPIRQNPGRRPSGTCPSCALERKLSKLGYASFGASFREITSRAGWGLGAPPGSRAEVAVAPFAPRVHHRSRVVRCLVSTVRRWQLQLRRRGPVPPASPGARTCSLLRASPSDGDPKICKGVSRTWTHSV